MISNVCFYLFFQTVAVTEDGSKVEIQTKPAEKGAIVISCITLNIFILANPCPAGYLEVFLRTFF